MVVGLTIQFAIVPVGISIPVANPKLESDVEEA